MDAEQVKQIEELQVAIGGFLAHFAVFESLTLTLVLKGLSYDPILVEHLPENMCLYQRLKLMGQLAIANGQPDALQKDVKRIRSVANVLLEYRNEFAHGTSALYKDDLSASMDDGKFTAGIQRRRSQRHFPVERPLTPEDVLLLQRKWLYGVHTIRRWAQISTELQNASLQLARKLEYHRHGGAWESITVPIVGDPAEALPQDVDG